MPAKEANLILEGACRDGARHKRVEGSFQNTLEFDLGAQRHETNSCSDAFFAPQKQKLPCRDPTGFSSPLLN